MSGGLVPRRPWRDRRIVLGVAGGIAAYKSVQLARDLTRLGAQVDVVLTRGASRFVTPLSFEALTGRKVLTELFSADGAAMHIRLGAEADAVCVAPATADLIARAAAGRADDLLTTTLLATRAPVVICPAMNDRMYAHPQATRNLAHLQDELGYAVAGPATGPLAFGEGEGPGRMLEPPAIVEHVGRALEKDAFLAGRQVLITTGPTREPVDPVRFVGNRSSGKQGYAVATEAAARGAKVTLVATVRRPVPESIELVLVETAEEMRAAALDRLPADVVVMAAAVADYRPTAAALDKIKKTGEARTISLEPTPDILAELGRGGEVGTLVGFAAETRDVLANAEAKLRAKGADLIVVNDVSAPSAGFDHDTNEVTLLAATGDRTTVPLASKRAVARAVLDRVAALRCPPTGTSM